MCSALAGRVRVRETAQSPSQPLVCNDKLVPKVLQDSVRTGTGGPYSFSPSRNSGLTKAHLAQITDSHSTALAACTRLPVGAGRAMEHALESGDSDSEDMEGGGGTSDHEHPDEPFEQPSPSKAPITCEDVRRGADQQGIPWSTLGTSRAEYRKQRLQFRISALDLALRIRRGLLDSLRRIRKSWLDYEVRTWWVALSNGLQISMWEKRTCKA